MSYAREQPEIDSARTDNEVPALSGVSLTRRFGGLLAVDDVNLAVPTRVIAGIIGPNGAGKTTLLNLLSGAVPPSSGRVLLGKTDITQANATSRAAVGVRRTFQNIKLFTQMTVLDNILVGQHVQTRGWVLGGVLRGPAVRRAELAARQRAHQVLDDIGLRCAPEALAGSLSYGDQRRLEMARALAAAPKVVLLDEPAAGLNSAEKARTAELIASLPSQFELSVLIVEHDMDLIRNTCSHVTVLDYGHVLCEGPPTTVLRDQRVIDAYLGTGDEP